MSDGEAWVGLEGDVVVARVRGEPTEALLRTTQEQVLAWSAKPARPGALRHAGDDAAAGGRAVGAAQLDEQLGAIRLKRAIVVPDSQLAYLARLAFGEGDYRVFYNDRAAAVRWLSDD